MAENNGLARNNTPIVLTIAGFDPSSGAGITADVKTAAAHGCFAVCCITGLTVQSTQGVQSVHPVRGSVIRMTLEELARDLPIVAIRLGMLGSAEAAEAVADFLDRFRPAMVVTDPVIRASSGAALLDEAGVAILKERILPLSAVVTPNVAEAEQLTGVKVETPEDQSRSARALLALGVGAAVVTGGHLAEPVDLLAWRGGDEIHEEHFAGEHLDSHSTHGTGCAFAMSLACGLTKGVSLVGAVADAKAYVRRAIEAAHPMGKGIGPVNHLWPFER